MADQEKINIIELDIKQEDVVKKLAAFTEQMKLLKDVSGLTAEQIEINKAQLKALSGEYQDNQKVLVNLTKSGNEELGTLQKLALSNKTLRAEQQKLNLETDTGRKRNEEINKAINTNTESIRKNSDSYVQQKMNIGNYKSALDGLPVPLKNAANGVSNFGKKFLILLTNPIVLTLTLIAGAIMSIGKAILSTDKGLTEYTARMEQLKATWSVYLQSIMNLKQGTAAAVDHFKASSKAAYEYVYALDAINDRQINNLSELQKLERQQSEAESQAKNQLLPIKERIALLEQSLELEKKILAIRIKDAEDLYNTELKLTAAKYDIDIKLLNRFIQANDDTAQKMLAIDSDLARARNAMNDDQQKKLEELYLAKDKLIQEKAQGEKRILSQLTGLYVSENKKEVDAAKTKSNDLEEIEKARIEHFKKLNEDARKAYTDFLIAATDDEIQAQIAADELLDAYEANRIAENARLKLEVQESGIQNEFELKQTQLNNDMAMELAAAEKTGADIALINQKYANYQIALEDQVQRSKFQIVSDFAGSIAGLLGEQTALGKIAAVAQATINTYLGATAAFAQTPGGIIIKSLAAATAVAQGILSVKKIKNTK
ncbi:MAG: hypothetical protein WC139_12905, partial [Candidatus Kapaibacterium sp.]